MIWIILTVGLILRFISLNQSLWLDEAINVLATQNFSLLGMITEYAKADFHPPGYFIILWLWAKMFGTGEIWVRIPSVIFGVLTIYVAYLIGSKLHSKTLGIFSALLLAINPLHIYYSQEARMYVFAALAVSLNIFIFIKLLKGEKFKSIFLIVSNILVLASDYVAYLIFPSQLIFLLFLKKKEVFKKWFIGFTIAILFGIWWIPTFLSQLEVGAVASENLPTWKFVVGAFDPKAIPLTFIKFIIGRISYPDKLIYALSLLPIVILFSLLIFRGMRFIKSLDRNLLVIWIAIPIIVATLISFIIPIYNYFRLLFTLPSFVILVASGIFSFKSKLKYTFLIVVILIQLISSLIYLSNPLYQREDWRGLVNFLKSKDENTLVLFESSGTLSPFDYYSKGSLNAKGALRDFPARDTGDLANLEEITQNSKHIYLVEYLIQISDPNRLVEKKFDELQFKKVETKDFTGVGFIHHYVR